MTTDQYIIPMKTRAALAKLHARYPSWNAPKLAVKLGISRQRVNQLARKLGLTLPKGRP